MILVLVSGIYYSISRVIALRFGMMVAHLAVKIFSQAKLNAKRCVKAKVVLSFTHLSHRLQLFVKVLVRDLTTSHTDAKINYRCLEKLEIGTCKETWVLLFEYWLNSINTHSYPAYYYNRETRECQPFAYSGCGGNGNRFLTMNQCESACAEFNHLIGGYAYWNKNYNFILRPGDGLLWGTWCWLRFWWSWLHNPGRFSIQLWPTARLYRCA